MVVDITTTRTLLCEASIALYLSTSTFLDVHRQPKPFSTRYCNFNARSNAATASRCGFASRRVVDVVSQVDVVSEVVSKVDVYLLSIMVGTGTTWH